MSGTAGAKAWVTTRGTGSVPHGPSHPDPEAGEITTLGWVLLLSQAGAEVAWQRVPAPEAQGTGRCLRREVAGILPSFLICATGDTEVHIPVRDLGKSESG